MRKLFIVAVNALLIYWEIIGLVLNIQQYGVGLFVYYTQLSNILAMLTSLLLIIYTAIDKSPRWLRFLRYQTTCCLTITFLVVLFLFAPPDNYQNSFFIGSAYYHHLLCPILTFISFLILEKGTKITLKDTLCSLIPTIVYGLVLIPLNILGKVNGPYFFLEFHKQPVQTCIVWLFLVLIAAYLIGLMIKAGSNLLSRYEKKN